MKFLDDIPFNQLMRLRTMELLLQSYGHFNRDIITRFHEVGSATVSRDISLYKSLNPGVHYNRKSKQIEKLSNFKPIFGG